MADQRKEGNSSGLRTAPSGGDAFEYGPGGRAPHFLAPAEGEVEGTTIYSSLPANNPAKSAKKPQ